MKSESQARRFKSKRNTVFLEGNTVVKRLKCPAKAKSEADMLDLLRRGGLAVPQVYGVDGCEITMEYVNAIPLPDLLDIWEESPDAAMQETVARKTVEWLRQFYGIVAPMSRGDINGRNFLFDGEKIWGVDFEEPGSGSILEDIGMLAAYALAYSPPHTGVKQKFAAQIADFASEAFGISAEDLRLSREAALESLERKRAARA